MSSSEFGIRRADGTETWGMSEEDAQRHARRLLRDGQQVEMVTRKKAVVDVQRAPVPLLAWRDHGVLHEAAVAMAEGRADLPQLLQEVARRERFGVWLDLVDEDRFAFADVFKAAGRLTSGP